jgi:hypothetical protein
MIWGWGMPASLWYFSGTVLAYFSGVDLTEKTLPYFNDTLQGAIFLVMQLFLSAAMNKGFELFEINDLNKRYETNNMHQGLNIMKILTSTLIIIVLGLPIFWFFMWIIKISGSLFSIYFLVFSVGIKVINNYLDFDDDQELPDDLPGLEGLRTQISNMASKKGFPAERIYKRDASKIAGKINASLIGFGKSSKIIIYDSFLAGHEDPKIIKQEPSQDDKIVS